jgi:hypothetical protein
LRPGDARGQLGFVSIEAVRDQVCS